MTGGMTVGKLLRVNMKEETLIFQELEEKYELLSGRALTSKIVSEEVRATSDPLGKHNKLVFACGLLAGTNVSSAGRLSVGAKSPLTGGIKESNAGGNAAYFMGRLDIRGIVIEDLPNEDKWYLIHVNENGAELKDAAHLVSLGVYEKAIRLYQEYGKQSSLILIGPAGEKRLLSAGVTNTDPDGAPTRYCARGGLGAVMGSKRVIAIVIEGRKSKISFSDKENFKANSDIYNKLILDTPQTNEIFPKYGTAAMTANTNALGALPTRNFYKGDFEGTSKIDGNAVYDIITARGGNGTPTHSCMVGCIIRCSNIFPDKEGNVLVSPLEYETIGLLGSNLCIDDLDVIARLNNMCNDYGVDTLEIGGAIGVFMEAGLTKFGDSKKVLELMTEIVNDTYLGRILASGVVITGKIFGQTRVPAVKGQGMPAYEPRSAKGLGVTYITSPMGADHTAGNTIRANVKPHLKDKQVETSLEAQVGATFMDYVGICLMVGAAVKDRNLIAELVSAKIGIRVTASELLEIARETLQIEKDFNKRAGFSKAHDRLPDYFYEEPNPSSNCVFDIYDDDLEV